MSPNSPARDRARARPAADGAIAVRRALLSVHDKTGVADFARGLVALGVEILSTGGTANLLRESGIPVRDVSEVTGFPEMLDGRVKTLHPHIHGGILARRDRPEHLETLARYGIPPIDLVAISLYPFESTIARPGVTLPEAIEQIDIGGPAMIRAAAKNHAAVAVVTDRSQYAPVVDELTATRALSAETRARLAGEAFRRTAAYDATIARYLGTVQSTVGGAGEARARTESWPTRWRLDLERDLELRYGENPHQVAAFYRFARALPVGIAAMKQLHGPELGYNNLLDFSAALGLLLEFDEPAAVVIKHTNPCGVAIAEQVGAATDKARASDPISIYGGVIGVNRPVDVTVVRALTGIFIEILFAPAFEADALEELRRTKKRCRVLEIPCQRAGSEPAGVEYRSVLGGVLVQSVDGGHVDAASLQVVSRRAPTAEESGALAFAWRVAKHVKSNAIVLATGDQVVGVGAGQMNRLDSARLAVARARAAGFETRGTVCASDAFFPFRDALDVVAEAGATAAIHPGGSVRDEEVVAAANEHGMAMVTTGIRHFRH